MSVTQEERNKANQVVEASKRTAHVDTGRLKRSIDVRVQKGILTFRQYFYGIYNDNSQLVDNARKMMGGTPYRIELLDNDGNVTFIDAKTGSGRTIKTGNTKPKPQEKAISGAKALINRIRSQQDGEKNNGKNSDKDNRRRT